MKYIIFAQATLLENQAKPQEEKADGADIVSESKHQSIAQIIYAENRVTTLLHFCTNSYFKKDLVTYLGLSYFFLSLRELLKIIQHCTFLFFILAFSLIQIFLIYTSFYLVFDL